MIDVELSLDALSKHVLAIESCHDNDADRRLGHVLALARLLRGDRVLSATLRDLEGDALAADATRVAEIGRVLDSSVEGCVRQLALEYQRTTDEAHAWRSIVDERDYTAKVSTGETLKSLLYRMRLGSNDSRTAELTSEDVVAFADVTLTPLEQRVTAARVNLPNVACQLREMRNLAGRYQKLRAFQVIGNSGDVASIARRFDALLSLWEERLVDGPTNESWGVPDDSGLHRDARTVASRLESALAGRRGRRLVLFRAKVFFEHFFYDEVRGELATEDARVASSRERGDRARARRESVLRRPFDRFIFQEGFFPITEASASRGRLDLLLTDADNAGVRPLVAEIKQAVRLAPDDIGLADVRLAIADARAEIARYVGHLRARPRWAGIEPMVVVFHTSREDVSSLEDDTTLLVDIGTRTPSQVVPVSGEEAAADASGDA